MSTADRRLLLEVLRALDTWAERQDETEIREQIRPRSLRLVRSETR